jgi:integrase
MNRPRVHNKHLPRNVYQRHGAFYYVKRGKWIRLGATLKEALNRYAGLYEAKAGTMPALISEALPGILEGVKPNTKKQYEIAARKLAKALGEFSPDEVTHGTVNKLMMQMSATPNMANRCLSLLRSVFKYAVKVEYVTTNPCIGIDRHREKKRDRLITFEELSAIYQASGPRLRVIIDLLLRTGQRIGDVLAIRRADLLSEGIAFRQQKTGAKVIVAWNEELREAVARAKALSPNISALTLLHNRRGKTPDYKTVRDQWDKARIAAKVEDATLHDLRAKAASDKDSIESAQALLGHASSETTKRVYKRNLTRARPVE